MTQRQRLGAYVLAADPTWIRTTVGRYYDALDVLVVAATSNGLGWTGAPVASEACIAAVREIDHRGIVRIVRGQWQDRDPMRADTAQRQAAIDAIGSEVDWILQLDTDELLPDVDALCDVLAHAEARGVDAVEWPMRVLYRRLRDGRYLQVMEGSGAAHFEYPGPIAVRPHALLVDARRVDGPFLRPVVTGDTESLQIARSPQPGELREPFIAPEAAILHNSWARSAPAVRAKVRSWGHGGTWKVLAYYRLVWLPSPVTWRWLRSFHPFAGQLWPRLGKVDVTVAIDSRDAV